jgi:hypothetical protein
VEGGESIFREWKSEPSDDGSICTGLATSHLPKRLVKPAAIFHIEAVRCIVTRSLLEIDFVARRINKLGTSDGV